MIKKSLICFSLLLLVFSVFCVTGSFAATYDELNLDELEIPSGHTVKDIIVYSRMGLDFRGDSALVITYTDPRFGELDVRDYLFYETDGNSYGFSLKAVGIQYYFSTYMRNDLGTGWKFIGTTERKITHTSNAASTFYAFQGIDYSTTNLYYEDGSLFFQLTPNLEETIAEGVQTMGRQVVGTMRILVVCGVGLIALLAGLGLFGKVFRIFQVK